MRSLPVFRSRVRCAARHEHSNWLPILVGYCLCNQGFLFSESIAGVDPVFQFIRVMETPSAGGSYCECHFRINKRMGSKAQYSWLYRLLTGGIRGVIHHVFARMRV